ncbi:sister chromatid cohesion acetyltransferase Eco1, putative [Talaromyces stipitatus ATCC 10500]|uniref:Sister chromatid cohesion acetyltransferase Eco1, putative n=1 Tax=Talaromyces stipitatus (strain ATCC 10500 / CBS 375.48 / QM 6759 / NRRL 1006) TaxID=441959 RepID=B8MNG4_TALSN|nr:sister chromatid cohesion acetyltransferase Eco1, putative [Talaromyces stipitatus ATCC 10500]EED14053.1 sister chromatid cohesion acetyltransferase Eco1, putative [Talaromyces stipitatus ATCC 10500]
MPWTVTNSFKRGLMKTYGRPVRRIYDDDTFHASKKRRVEAADDSDDAESNLRYAIRESSIAITASSPSRRNSVIFSEITQEDDDDDDDDLSTPPSSPPPPRLTPPPANTRKPTFAFLKRKKSSTVKEVNGSPLAEVNSNSVRSSVDQPKKSQSAQPRVLRQLQIDAGVTVRRSCNLCGMEYVPSNAEDADLHDKFHSMNAVGIDLGKAFVRANASRWVYEAARCDEGYVVIVDRKASPSARNQAKKVLDVVNRELSSPPIDDATLWSQIEPPKRLRKNGAKEETDRYKVFLHMKDSKCMGLCLAERIWEAHPVKLDASNGVTVSNGDGPHRSSSVTVQNTLDPAIVGVSRIWTCGSARRRGIAMDLLDCVISNFIYGLDIPKEQIAFTQPTESGIRLAECFFGAGEPWHVYNEGVVS